MKHEWELLDSCNQHCPILAKISRYEWRCKRCGSYFITPEPPELWTDCDEIIVNKIQES
jgi:hypothetical protein